VSLGGLLMKKLTAIIICLFIILSISQMSAFAAIKLVYDGKVHMYDGRAVSLIINDKTLNPKVPPIIMQGTTLVPARAVFEEMGAKVTWNKSAQQVTVTSAKNTIVLVINSEFAVVNGKKEKLLMPAKIINENTMIPLRFVSEKMGLDVKWNSASYEIKISEKKTETDTSQDNNTNTSSGVINNISFETSSEKTLVTIQSDSSISDYSKLELNEEGKSFRLVIDIPEKSINISQLTIPVDDGRITKIRSAQYQLSPKKVRVVLDMTSKLSYSLDFTQDKKALLVSIGGSISQEDKLNGSQTGTVEDYEYFNSKIGEDNTVALKDEGEKICVTINKNKSQEIKVQRGTKPDSVEIEINKAKFKEDKFTIPISSSPVTSLMAEMIDAQKGKITIITSSQVPYQIYDDTGSLNIYIYKEGYKNIRYENSGAISTLIISKADTSKQVTIEQGTKKNEAKILLPEGLADIQSGDMYINDEMLKSFEISDENDSGREIDIKFSVESNISYSVRTDTMKNIYVYFFARDKVKLPDGDILIAIDAGHGGKDPGAVYKDKNGVVKVEEADWNLDIACRLNKILTDLGIPTVMTRSKDEYVELHQRPNLANSMKADLFVSIHNNWIDNPSVAGTMTLYFPYDNSDRGLTSKRFAEIVQEEMLRTIDTADRKIVARPNLVVLNSTEMPAILVECGFLSNDSDRNKLAAEEYRDKIAQALYTAVIRALGEL